MKYSIQGEEVTKEEFDSEFEKELEAYKPFSEFWPRREEVKDYLSKRRYFEFPKSWKYFVAVEDEIYEMMEIIQENEYDIGDNDSLAIALALWNKGYRKVKK